MKNNKQYEKRLNSFLIERKINEKFNNFKKDRFLSSFLDKKTLEENELIIKNYLRLFYTINIDNKQQVKKIKELESNLLTFIKKDALFLLTY